jgi:hypothetical protein
MPANIPTQWKVNACEPLHVQLNLPDRRVGVINTRLAPQPGLEVTARVHDFDGRLRRQHRARLDAPANAFQEALAVTNLDDATWVSFVKLELNDARGQLLSDNFNWLAGKDAAGFKALQTLPPVRLKTTSATESRGSEIAVRATVTNPTDHVAFFIQLAVTQGSSGAEVLPVLWSDN